jgi:hypothetical protein
MKTNSELLERAYGIAESFLYCDDECLIPWEPFEHWPDELVKDQLHDLAQTILLSLQWAQGENNEN